MVPYMAYKETYACDEIKDLQLEILSSCVLNVRIPIQKKVGGEGGKRVKEGNGRYNRRKGLE